MTTTDNTVGDLNHLNTQATTTTTKQPTNCATYILKKIQDDRTSATSVGFLSNWVREWYLNHPNELVNELKKNNWDITSAGGQIASNLNNNVLSCIPNKTTEDGDKKSSPLDNENNNWKSMIREFETKKNELEKELKSLKSRKGFLYQLSSDEITDDTYKLRNEVESKIFEKEIEVKILKDDFKGLKKSHEDNLKKLIKNKPSAYDDISLTGKDLDNFLKGIINGISSLDNYKAEPTDLESRMKFNPRKLMTLQEALFTILWNTRPQTISSSIINLKAWCAAFMRFVKYGTRDSNTPGMLTFISRKDNGDVKGSCGKTTIFKSLLQLLEENGISVTPYVDPVAFPTRKVIDKKMSGRTLVFFDDVGQDSVVGNDYETMNQFLDGRNLRTKMKYEYTKKCVKLRNLFKILSPILWVGTAVFLVFVGFVLKKKPESNEANKYLVIQFTNAFYVLGISVMITIILAIIAKDKVRNTVWMANILLSAYIYGTTGMYIVFAIQCLDEYVVRNLGNYYASKALINKEIDKRE